jgi:hypothetical protein
MFVNTFLGEFSGKAGFVYLLSDQNGNYKIGKTTSLDNRIKALNTQPPFELQLIAFQKTSNNSKLEADYHKKYSHKRLRGEWFKLTSDDVDETVKAFSVEMEKTDAIARAFESFDPVNFEYPLEAEISHSLLFTSCIEGGRYIETY